MPNLSPPLPPLRVAQFGLGPIGIASLKLLATKPWVRVVGGVDIDPAKLGRTISEIAGIEGCEARVFAGFDALWEAERPDVVVHTAGSKAALALEQCRPICAKGLPVVSSCEELLYPYHRARDLATEFDRQCLASGGRIVATGVNPGFVLDVLPLVLTGVCRDVREVRGRRVVNASTRRQPLQAKIGSGLSPEAFRALFREGKAGHAGFPESVRLIAHGLGWDIGDIAETCEPVVADREIQTAFFKVPVGATRGLHQTATAETADGRRIALDLTMALDEPDPHDAIQILGDPPLDARLNGGVAGDIATVAALVNTIPRIVAAAPGVRLLTDLPVATCH